MKCSEVKKIVQLHSPLTLPDEIVKSVSCHLDICPQCNSAYRQKFQLAAMIIAAHKLQIPDYNEEKYWSSLRKNLIGSLTFPLTPIAIPYWQNLARISVALILFFFILIPGLDHLIRRQESPYAITVYGSIDVIVEKAFTSGGSLDIKTCTFTDPDMTFIILDKKSERGTP